MNVVLSLEYSMVLFDLHKFNYLLSHRFAINPMSVCFSNLMENS
jgi:hypothetical protein